MIQYNHHTATLWQRKKREKERNFNSKNTTRSSKQYYLPEYLIFLFKEPADKENKNRGGNWRSYYRCTWYTYHIKDTLDNHEQSGGGAGCKRPRQRGTDASFTCVFLRSCRDVRRPRHLPNAKTVAIFQPESDPDGTTKKQMSYS